MHDAALIGDDAVLCVGHLVDGFAAHLPHAFDDELHAGHACLRKQSARSVHRQGATKLQIAFRGEGAALPWFAEPVVFQGQQRRDGEAVIDLGHINIGRCQPRRRERCRRRDFGRCGRQIGALADLP